MPELDLIQYLDPISAIVVMSFIAGWSIRSKQDKANREYLKSMLDETEKKLQESDEICQHRVNDVREDMQSQQRRNDREIDSIRKSHRDEVGTLKGILQDVMKRLDEITK